MIFPALGSLSTRILTKTLAIRIRNSPASVSLKEWEKVPGSVDKMNVSTFTKDDVLPCDEGAKSVAPPPPSEPKNNYSLMIYRVANESF